MEGNPEDLNTGLNTTKVKAAMLLTSMCSLFMPFLTPYDACAKSMGTCTQPFCGSKSDCQDELNMFCFVVLTLFIHTVTKVKD